MATAATPIADKPRQRLSAEARKASFLEAAGLLIREKGLEGLTMEGLAAYCKVNKALPYRHFANRDDVLVALYEQENRDFDARLESASAGAVGFQARLRALIGAWYSDVSRATGTPELMQARTTSGELESRRQVRMQIAADFIADLIQESYEIGRDKAKLAANVLLAGRQGLAAFWRIPEMDHEALNESFITMSLGAVEAIADGALEGSS